MFKDGRTNIHDDERNGRPSSVSDDLVQNVDQNSMKDGTSQFQNFNVKLHKFQALFAATFSQLDQAATRFAQDGFR
jgi:hypothetical protein